MLYFFALIPAATMTRQQLLNEGEHDIMRKLNSINITYHSLVWRSVSGKTVPKVLDTADGPLAEGSTNNRGTTFNFFNISKEIIVKRKLKLFITVIYAISSIN